MARRLSRRRPGPRGRRLSAGLIVALCLLAPPSAGAGPSAFSEVQRAYSHSVTGTLPPCAFSSATLEAALAQAPSYDLQYQADFTNAISAALAARAAGACRHPGSAAAGSPGAGTRELRPATLPRGPGSATGAGLPLVLILLLGLVALALGGLLIGGTVAALGLDGPRLRGVRHAVAEAEYRLGALWTDLSDRFAR